MILRWRTATVALASLAVILSGCGDGGDTSDSGDTSESKKMNVGVYQGTLTSVIDYLAVRKGFLEEEGYEAELFESPLGPQLVTALIGGETDVSMVSPSFWSAIEQGECFKTFANGHKEWFTLIAQPDLDIPAEYPASVKALKGLRIGIVGRGTTTERLASIVLEEAGLDPATDVSFVGVGGALTSVTAFEQDQIDALFSFPPVEEVLTSNGTEYQEVVNLFDGEVDVIKPVMLTYVAASCSFAEKNPEALDAYCRAYNDAFAWAVDPANKDEMIQFAATVMNVKPEVASAIWNRYGAAMFAAGPTPDEETWNLQPKFFPGIKKAPDFSKYAMTDCG